jgi:hypothetical protein
VQQWHTFIGGSGREESMGMAVDGSGNVYVSGVTGSFSDWGTPVNPSAGAYEAFAVKLNSNGVPQWHTFIGSSHHDAGGGIAVDGGGNVYVTGWSSATWGSPENAHAGGGNKDAFAVILDSDGVRQWNTFMGSPGHDFGEDIAADTSGHVYMTGFSDATWGAPVNPYTGVWDDAFAVKIDVSHVVGGVFADGFESGNCTAWSLEVPELASCHLAPCPRSTSAASVTAPDATLCGLTAGRYFSTAWTGYPTSVIGSRLTVSYGGWWMPGGATLPSRE